MARTSLQGAGRAWLGVVAALVGVGWGSQAAAQQLTVTLAGNERTNVAAALGTLNTSFNGQLTVTTQNADWATTAGNPNVIVLSEDRVTSAPPATSYATYLNNGGHIVVVGWSDDPDYAGWVDDYFGITTPPSVQGHICDPDWIRTQTHPINQFLGPNATLPLLTTGHGWDFTVAQPAGVELIGRACESNTEFSVAVRELPSGGSITVVNYNLPNLTLGASLNSFLVPLLRGYFGFIRAGLNQPPVVTNPGARANAEGDVVSLAVSGSDPNNDPLTWSAANLPTGLSIDPSTGLISGTLSFTSAGSYNVSVTASDGVRAATVNFTWTVNNTNRAPTVTAIPNQSGAEGQAVNLTPTGVDPDGQALTWSATGLPMGLAINPGTGAITGNLDFAASDSSPYAVTVSATDGSLSTSVGFTWTVANTNRAPTVTAVPNQSSAEGANVSLQVAGVDPDGEVVTWFAAGLPSGLSIGGGTGLISGVVGFDASANSPYTVTVTATDGAAVTQRTFVWTVTNTNRPPALENLGDQSSEEGDTVNLSASALDPDGDMVLYSAMGLPPGLAMGPTGQIAGSVGFNASANSPYLVTVTATDGAASDSVSFVWLVGDTNRAPVVSPLLDRTDSEGQVVALSPSASDADNDALTWSAVGLPASLTINPATGEVTGTLSFAAAASSPYNVEISATDGTLTGRASFVWTVNNVNRAPIITTALPNRTNNENQTVNLPLAATDADNEALTWSATNLPTGLQINASTGLISGRVAYTASPNSPYAVTVTVTDGIDPASASFSWIINNTNRAPAVTNPGARASAEGEVVSLQVRGSDADGDVIAWSATGLPQGLGIDAQTGLISGMVGFDAAASSPFSVTVSATDGVATTRRTFAWTVTNTNRPPVVTRPQDQTSLEGQGVTLAVVASDPDGQGVTFSAANLPAGLTINPQTGVISGTVTFEASAQSPYATTVFVTDGALVSAASFVWSIVETNRPPVTDAGGPYTVNEGAQVVLGATGSDPDGNALTFSWDLDNDGQCDDAQGDSATFTGVDGAATVTVRVCATDGLATATDSTTVTVRNVAPSVDFAGVDPAEPQEAGQVTLTASATDPAGNADPLVYTWSFGDGTASEQGDSVTHIYTDAGTYSATVTVSDGDGGTATATVVVTVGDVAPSITNLSGPLTLNEGTAGTWRFTLGKAANDDVLWTFVWGDGTANNTGRFQAVATSAVIPRPHTYADNGTYTLTVTARDDDNVTVSATTSVTVLNVAPTITDLSAPAGGQEGEVLDFAASASDPGRDTLTYAWDFGDGSMVQTGQALSHAFDDAGTYVVTLTVSDEDGGRAQRQTTVVITNGPPVIASLTGDTTGNEGQSLSFTAQASDPGRDALTYTWSFGDGSPDEQGVELTSVNHAFADNGAYTVTVTVTDGVDVASRALAVNVRNVAPTLANANVPATGNEGQALSFSAQATDPAGVNDPLTYTWAWGDGTPNTTGSAATHAYADNGAFIVTLTVRDDDGGTLSRTFSVTVANVAPLIGLLDGDFVGEEGQTFDYLVTASDPGTDTLTYTWSFGDGSQPQTGRDLTAVSHVYTRSGAYNLVLTVADEDGGSSALSRTVNVGGQVPSLVRLDGDTEGDEGSSFAYSALASDPGNDLITYAWDFGDGSAPVRGIGLTDPTHVYAEDGNYTVTLTVSDDDGSSQGTLEVTVNNVAPSIDALTAPQAGDEGQSLSFSARASDPAEENDPLSYVWSFGDGTPSQTGAAVTHRFANEGSYTVTLTVSDDEGASTTRTSVVEISNVAPIIARLLGNPNGSEGQALSFQAVASDPGSGDVLTYTWSFGDGSPSRSGRDLGQVSHTYADNGAYVVTLRVDDGLEQATATLNLTINNVAPVITTLDGTRAGDEGATFSYTAAATDAAGANDPLTYTWNFGDGSNPESGRDLTAVDHVYRLPGVYALTLVVADDDGGVTTRVLVVTVRNLAPQIVSLTGDTTGNEGATFGFTASATDGSGDALTYTWSWGDGTASSVGQGLTDVTHVFRDDGIYNVTLTVSDGPSSAQRSLQVTVGNVAPSVVGFLVPATGAEGQTLQMSAQATDPAGINDPLAYVWSFGDGSPNEQGSAQSHAYADDGVYTVTLTVSDDDGGAVTRTATVTITNGAPQVLALNGPAEVLEGSAASFQAVATDAPTDTLSYEWRFEGGPTVQGQAAAHTYADDGVYVVTLVVTDEDGGSTTRTRSLTVRNANPSITALTGDFSGQESEVLAFEASASDPGVNDVLTYAWDFGDGSSRASGVGLTQTTHAWADAGVYTLTLTVTDGDGGEAVISRSVNVGTAAPTLLALRGPNRANEGQAVTFEAEATDPTGQALTYTWDFGDGSPSVSGPEASVTHTFADNGSFFLSLTVTDEDDLSVGGGQRVDVLNLDPTISAFEVGPFAEGQPGPARAQASDPAGDRDILIYTWAWGDGSQSSAGGLTDVRHTYAASGNYTIVLTVTDGDGGVAVRSQQVTVGGQPPVIAEVRGPRQLVEGAQATFEADATDPGGDPLTYTWQIQGQPSVSTGRNAVFTGLFAEDGSYAVTVVALDDEGQSATQTIQVEVSNAAPSIQSLVGPAVGDEGQVLSFFAVATDPGGANDPLTYAWSWGDGSNVEQGVDLNSAAHAYAQDGTYVVTLTVSDDDGEQTSQTLELVIGDANPVIVSLLGPSEGQEGGTFSYTASATDAGGDALSYAWSWGDGTPDGEGSQASHTYADDGIYLLRLTVTDDGGRTAQRELQVTVANVAPTITSSPGLVAQVGRAYAYTVEATDPGDDVLTSTLLLAPEGMSLVDGLLSWRPSAEQGEGGPYAVELEVCDEDGACARQAFNIRTDLVDSDNDGAPDDCEEQYGLDPQDPADGALDNDQDGLSNRDECARGTDPTVSNAPNAPTPTTPDDEERVSAAQPTLVVLNAADPDGDALTYAFEVYADANLTRLVASVTALVEGQGSTSWTVDPALADNAGYWWRARANDGFASGPWSEVSSFFVDVENEAPGVPVLVYPLGAADSLTPTLTLDPVTDPEGDAVTYLYEVYSDEALANLVASGEADEVVWTTDPALDEDNAYWWRAAARDDLGAQSAWATPARFTTNTNNTLPEAPKVIAPSEGERVGAVPVAVVWEQAVDNDGDELLYELEVARDESFGEVVFSQAEIPMGDENTVTVEVEGLEEDASYWLRVRASDFEGAGPYKVVAFSINADPTPPTAPTLISPVDGVVVDGPTVRFSFSSAQDFDGDTLTYVVKVSRDEGGRDVVASLDDIADSDVEISVELEIAEAGEYWWTAFAVDSTNLEGPSAVAENFKLTIDTNAPPSAPVLVSPVDGATVDISKDFVLTWEDATDPDGDALTYEVGVYSDEALAVAVFEVDEVAQGEGGQSTVTVPGFETSAELLFWTVRAKDSAGNVGPAATPGEFKPEIKAGQVAGGGGDGCDCAVGGSKQGAPWTAGLLLGLLVWWSRRRR